MKNLLLILFAGLMMAALPQLKPFTLSGTVTDESGTPLAGVTVRVKETNIGAVTDEKGHYSLKLEPGTYTIEISYIGYESLRMLDVKVNETEENRLDAQLKSGAVLQEMVVTAIPKRGNIFKERSKSSREYSMEIAKSPTASEVPSAPSAEPKPLGAISTRDIAHEAPAPGTKPMNKPVIEPTKKMIVEEMAADDAEKTAGPVIGSHPEARAGLLTAGEWNDLHNWRTHWTDLLADGEIKPYEDMYHFYPKNRYAVLLQNEAGVPISDVVVRLTGEKGATIWAARTDNTGAAELWHGLYQPKEDAPKQIVATIDGRDYRFDRLTPYADGINRLQVKRECSASRNVDIVWAVDATGSMGDEIEYLKVELLDVIGRVKSANPELAIRMGTVFYRDQTDEYLVKSSGLSPDIEKTVEYIRRQFAGGGGDYPEAVHSALEEAINNQAWSEQAVARICFLVLDASPHQKPEVIESLQKSIREAARKGIRVVPVSASGVQKDTEFLMKFFGLATNGSYVFLTDHSGIGEKHIEATTDEYKVELLNDLLVRLINDYAKTETCEGKSTIRFEDRQQPDAAPIAQALYYPNPAFNQFKLELPFDAAKVTVYDASGKAARNLGSLNAGVHTVQISGLPAGAYTLRIWREGQAQSGQLMILAP